MDVKIRKTIELNEEAVDVEEYDRVKIVLFRSGINQEHDAFAAAAMWKKANVSSVVTGVIPWYDEDSFELKLVIE